MMMDDWMAMGGYGPGHWLVFALFVALIIYQIGRILGRIALSPLWSVLAFIPIINLISLWVLAFSRWPRDGARTS